MEYALICHDSQRIPKKVRCQTGVMGEVSVYTGRNLEDELTRAALATKDAPGEWAVLARTSIQLARMELALSQRGIPYWIDSDSDIWASGLGAALLALLRSLIVSDPTPELRRAVIDLRIHVRGHAPAFPTDPANGNDDWLGWMERQSDDLTSAQRSALLSLPIRWQAWQQNHRDTTKLVVQDINEWVRPLIREKEDKLFRALSTCLEKRRGGIANRILCRQLRAEKPHGVVTLSTMHSSKGLEFDRVWICGMDAREEGETDYNPDEERRLHYVGITRAKIQLVMSFENDHGPGQQIREAGVAPKPSTRRARQSYFR